MPPKKRRKVTVDAVKANLRLQCSRYEWLDASWFDFFLDKFTAFCLESIAFPDSVDKFSCQQKLSYYRSLQLFFHLVDNISFRPQFLESLHRLRALFDPSNASNFCSAQMCTYMRVALQHCECWQFGNEIHKARVLAQCFGALSIDLDSVMSRSDFKRGYFNWVKQLLSHACKRVQKFERTAIKILRMPSFFSISWPASELHRKKFSLTRDALKFFDNIPNDLQEARSRDVDSQILELKCREMKRERMQALLGHSPEILNNNDGEQGEKQKLGLKYFQVCLWQNIWKLIGFYKKEYKRTCSDEVLQLLRLALKQKDHLVQSELSQ